MQRSRKAIAFGPIGTSLASSGATLLCRLKAPNMVRATSCHACCQLIAASFSALNSASPNSLSTTWAIS